MSADDLGARWLEAFLGGAPEQACTPDVAYEDPLSNGLLEGPAQLAAHAERLRAAFPDVAVERSAPALAEGRHACVPWRLTGTNEGELAVVPATGRRLVLHGLHYLELDEGRVRRARGFFDTYDAATQLGILPTRGGMGEAALMALRGFGLVRRQ